MGRRRPNRPRRDEASVAGFVNMKTGTFIDMKSETVTNGADINIETYYTISEFPGRRFDLAKAAVYSCADGNAEGEPIVLQACDKWANRKNEFSIHQPNGSYVKRVYDLEKVLANAKVLSRTIKQFTPEQVEIRRKVWREKQRKIIRAGKIEKLKAHMAVKKKEEKLAAQRGASFGSW